MTDVTATFWFLLLSVIVTVHADVFDFNKEVDGILHEFQEAGDTEVPLPKIRAQFSEKVLFVSFKGDFNGTKGTIKDLSTIKRTGNASLVTAGDHFVFRVELGLGELKIGYKYRAKFMGIPFNGQLDLEIGDNSLYIEILLNFTDNRCSGSVENIRQLRFTTLDRMSVKVTGFSVANRFMNYLLSRSFNHVSPNVVRPIEEYLNNLFKATFKQFNFCKFGSVPENKPFDEAQSSDDISSQMYPENSNSTVQDISAMLQ